jgi:methylornithine synthase
MTQSNYRQRLVEILERAAQEEILERKEIAFLLGLKQKSQIDAVLEVARNLRRRHFGDRVFLYGFLYFSTYCRNDCNFCYYRRTNSLPKRYRRHVSELVEAARRLADSGVHLIDLTLGEDPLIFNDHKRGFRKLIELVRAVREEAELPIMVSPGVVPHYVLAELVTAGANWFACYQETHNTVLFEKLRPGQNYAARLKIKKLAFKLGLLVEEGILYGVGESVEDTAESIEVMRCLQASQIRVMSFVPQKGTPMQRLSAPDSLREMLTIAVLRLVFPDRLIPATLDVAGLAGLQCRLEAGANVVTSLVPPGFGLAGVAQSSLDISEAKRTVESIVLELEKLGLHPAALEDYIEWVENRRKKIMVDLSKERIAC